MEDYYRYSVNLAELREGMVLNQNLPGPVDLRQGRVLTTTDIKRIREIPPDGKLSVVVSRSLKTQLNLPDLDGQTRKNGDEWGKNTLKSLKISHYREVLGEQDTKMAVFDPALNESLKSVVEKKLLVIRDDDYTERVENHKKAHLEKFKSSINSLQNSNHDETISMIGHCAKTNADMESLERVDALETGELVKRSDVYEQNAEYFMESVLTAKRVYTSFVENIVVDFLADMGYQLARGMLAFLSKNEAKFSFISSHSLQVMIIALVSAIELTRIINQKSLSLNADDIKTLLSINKKSFTLDELVNLGIAALLHDIEFRKQLPGLKQDSVFNIQHQSIVDLHPSNGFHIAQMLNIDFDVQRAIFQHHERFDGSGYPSGLSPRFYTKYTPVLMFAEYYTEMVTKNPFLSEVASPRETVVKLLSNERSKFDGDTIYAFLRAVSLYPIGSWVLLSDNRIGVVRRVNTDKLEKPVVEIHFNHCFKRVTPEEVNLMQSSVEIVKPLSWNLIRDAVKGPMDFIFH
ncbi:MAG: hypothetical protein A2Y33_02940 [Spirochaetes bacterium GWF1_51_8]|nr:MAG: hypothetical protein A2Y33_02940 [Spirochaetes bacterium GWF1_51_8]